MSEQSAPWRPDDHPPHEWPIGTAASWRDGYGCPTIWCKGEGPRRRDEAFNTRSSLPAADTTEGGEGRG